MSSERLTGDDWDPRSDVFTVTPPPGRDAWGPGSPATASLPMFAPASFGTPQFGGDSRAVESAAASYDPDAFDLSVPGAVGGGAGSSRRGSRVGTVAVVAVSTGVSGVLVGRAAQAVAGDKMAPWILGRASGICAYVLMLALVVLGLVLSHPSRARWRRPSAAVRIRAHVSLAVFTGAFVVLHVVVLATDKYANVGWWGALLPMGSQYRPVPVTLGVICTYAGVLAGVTAVAAGRWAAKVWWPVHKVAALVLVLAWLHGVLSGIDTPSLWWLYVVTAALVVVLGASRYLTRRSDDVLAAGEAQKAGSR